MLNEIKTFVERPPPSILGDGSAGMVLAGQWIKGNGQEEMAVACKRFYRHNGGTDKFHREYQTLFDNWTIFSLSNVLGRAKSNSTSHFNLIKLILF